MANVFMINSITCQRRARVARRQVRLQLRLPAGTHGLDPLRRRDVEEACVVYRPQQQASGHHDTDEWQPKHELGHPLRL